MQCDKQGLNTAMFGTFSKGILLLPFLSELLGAPVVSCRWFRGQVDCFVILGWGHKPNTLKARRYAQRKNKPYWRLEDGFLRSYGPGKKFPPLSLMLDKTGIYYDSTCSNDLEYLLQHATEVLVSVQSEKARALIITHQLSKYNHAPLLRPGILRANDSKRVLVVDQTRGDLSVSLGGADADTFVQMLMAARQENPEATIYVKVHPETTLNYKQGYLDHVMDDTQTVVLREAINPLSLMEHMDKVYVVTSQLGFEALLLEKPVTVFGLPWYACWGVTDDRQYCSRRTKSRNTAELFAAAFLHYAVYLNPYTHTKGTIFDVIDWLIQQRNMVNRHLLDRSNIFLAKRVSAWKRSNIQAFLSLQQTRLFLARRNNFNKLNDRLVYWGRSHSVTTSSQKQLTLEDGFIRSVGLGAKRVRPLSLVVDQKGIYFDPRFPSDLEDILNYQVFDEVLLEQARRVRRFIVQHRLTKYNVESLDAVDWYTNKPVTILIPGQVDNDASVRLGAVQVADNFKLIQTVRTIYPDAYIVYKPHPDVSSGYRKGHLKYAAIMDYVDYVETHTSIISCIDAADAIHTMTSLSGFDALLRGKQVVTYGEPFYAGWGLTEDTISEGKSSARRRRRLSIDELVAGVLLCYPLYYDWTLNGYTSCEAVLRQILKNGVIGQSGAFHD
jgi:capsular polysaccharide export protein